MGWWRDWWMMDDDGFSQRDNPNRTIFRGKLKIMLSFLLIYWPADRLIGDEVICEMNENEMVRRAMMYVVIEDSIRHAFTRNWTPADITGIWDVKVLDGCWHFCQHFFLHDHTHFRVKACNQLMCFVWMNATKLPLILLTMCLSHGWCVKPFGCHSGQGCTGQCLESWIQDAEWTCQVFWLLKCFATPCHSSFSKDLSRWSQIMSCWTFSNLQRIMWMMSSTSVYHQRNFINYAKQKSYGKTQGCAAAGRGLANMGLKMSSGNATESNMDFPTFNVWGESSTEPP